VIVQCCVASKQHDVEILGEVRPATVVVMALANGTLWIGVDPPGNRLYDFKKTTHIMALSVTGLSLTS